MTRIVVVGGTGVAGTAAIRASRERFGSDAHVTAVWYARKEEPLDIPGADAVLFGDVSDPGTLERIRAVTGDAIDFLFYATARGDVGFPVSEATPEQVAAANVVSFDPLLTFERAFRCGLLVGYSTFFRLRIQEITYGAMGHAKARIERWVGESPRHACIRAGAFASESSRAIGLLLGRMARDKGSLADPMVQDFFAGRSTQEGLERLHATARAEEREAFGDSGTGPEGLLEAHRALLRTEFAEAVAEGRKPDRGSPRFVNVCGMKVWRSAEAQPAV